MERERTIITGLMLLLLGLWLSLFLHQSARFAGSAWGGVLGVSAALLMLVPLAYTLVKRIAWLKEVMKDTWPLAKLLKWHIYASMLGAFLAILHSGHKFQSWLGIALMTVMLLAILSGYIGRHFLRYVSQELKEREETLVGLRAAYDALAKRIITHPPNESTATFLSVPAFMSRFRKGLAAAIAGTPKASETDIELQTIEITDAIADMEYAISADDSIKRKLRIWLVVHIGTSIAFYVLLLLHIAAGIQFGLRWFS